MNDKRSIGCRPRGTEKRNICNRTYPVFIKVEDVVSAGMNELSHVELTPISVANEAIYLSYNDTLSLQAKPCNKYLVKSFWNDLRSGKSKTSYFIGREKAAKVFYDMVIYSLKEIRIFQLNCEEYPFAANPYDCLAEAYLKKGDNEQAVNYYKEALRRDPGFSSAIKALKELEN